MQFKVEEECFSSKKINLIPTGDYRYRKLAQDLNSTFWKNLELDLVKRL